MGTTQMLLDTICITKCLAWSRGAVSGPVTRVRPMNPGRPLWGHHQQCRRPESNLGPHTGPGTGPGTQNARILPQEEAGERA